MLDDAESKIESLEQRLEELENRLREMETETTDEGSSSSADDFLSSSITIGSNTPKVHWIDPEEETQSFQDCSEINTVADAEKAFKEAAEWRSDVRNASTNVSHGDILVLLCNKSPSIDDDDDESTPEVYTDACYFMGLCLTTATMLQDPLHDEDLKLVESIEVDDVKIHQFLAWSSCGKSGLTEDYWKITVKACVDGESKDIDILTTTEPEAASGEDPVEPYGYIFRHPPEPE